MTITITKSYYKPRSRCPSRPVTWLSEGLVKKHEVLYEYPGFLFMSRENTRYNFIPNKFVGFRRLGYIYILYNIKNVYIDILQYI